MPFIIRHQSDGLGGYFPRFLFALRLGRSFSAPFPLFSRPLPLFPAPVLPLNARPRWLEPLETHPRSLSDLGRAEQQVAAMFQVRSIPMIVVFREGIGLFQQAGALPPAALDELLEKVAELDMDEVRAQVEAQQAEETPSA